MHGSIMACLIYQLSCIHIRHTPLTSPTNEAVNTSDLGEVDLRHVSKQNLRIVCLKPVFE